MKKIHMQGKDCVTSICSKNYWNYKNGIMIINNIKLVNCKHCFKTLKKKASLYKKMYKNMPKRKEL